MHLRCLTTGNFYKFKPLIIPYTRKTVWMYGHTGIGSARMLSLPQVANLLDVSTRPTLALDNGQRKAAAKPRLQPI